MVPTLATALQASRTSAALSLRDLARIADLPPSTISRAEKGADVSLSMLARLSEAADLGPDLRPVGRPEAITVARILLGDEGLREPAEMSYWVERWRRLGAVGVDGAVRDVRGLALRAGRSGYLAKRPNSVDAIRTGSAQQLALQLERAGVEYAITGAAGANNIAEYADAPWPVVYVENLRAGLTALGAMPRLPGERGAPMTLILFDGFSEVGRARSDDGLVYADPWQIVMDCYGGIDRMPNQADWILDAWEIATW